MITIARAFLGHFTSSHPSNVLASSPHAANPNPPRVDLSGLLREVEDLPEPISSQSLFGNDRPLEIEIGSGKGLFLATESIANPDQNFLVSRSLINTQRTRRPVAACREATRS